MVEAIFPLVYEGVHLPYPLSSTNASRLIKHANCYLQAWWMHDSPTAPPSDEIDRIVQLPRELVLDSEVAVTILEILQP